MTLIFSLFLTYVLYRVVRKINASYVTFKFFFFFFILNFLASLYTFFTMDVLLINTSTYYFLKDIYFKTTYLLYFVILIIIMYRWKSFKETLVFYMNDLKSTFKNENIFMKIFTIILFPIVVLTIVLLPSIVLATSMYIIITIYFHAYFIIFGEKINKLMIFESYIHRYKNSKSLRFKPERTLNLEGTLGDSYGVTLKDKSPFSVYGSVYINEKEKMILLKEGYTFNIIGRKTKFGYQITYHPKHMKNYEYTQNELLHLNNLKYHIIDSNNTSLTID